MKRVLGNSIIKVVLFTSVLVFLFTILTYAGTLEVHNIDVGQADAALIICDGQNMLIDGGGVSDSSLVYSYLEKHGVKRLDYIICTHDDEDHIGGIPGAVNLVKSNIGKVYAPYKNRDKGAFVTLIKELDKNNKKITMPSIGNRCKLGSAVFDILSVGTEGNDASIVVRIVNGKHSFLFMGDATEELEKKLAEKYDLKSTMLKVGHHGSSTSSCMDFIKEVNPEYSVISVGKDNSYGHPAEEVLRWLSEQGSKIYRTDNDGDIVFHSDGNKMTVTIEKKYHEKANLISGVVGTQESISSKDCESARQYVLNTNSMKFHYPDCDSVGDMKKKNRKDVTDIRENIISQGYVPCKRCHP